MTTTQWTDEQIAQQFRLEVQARFATENEEYLRLDREETAQVKAAMDAKGQPHPDWLSEENDSFLWEAYVRSEIQINLNLVRLIAPSEFAIGADFVEMLDGTSVGWTRPSIGARLVDGIPRVAIELLLVDSWDDARHQARIARDAKDAKDVRGKTSAQPMKEA